MPCNFLVIIRASVSGIVGLILDQIVQKVKVIFDGFDFLGDFSRCFLSLCFFCFQALLFDVMVEAGFPIGLNDLGEV